MGEIVPISMAMARLGIGEVLNPKVHSFIVRIWTDTEDGHETAKDGEWRGSIDHVGTGHRLYFRELDSILCFISEQVSGTVQGRSRGLLASLKRLVSRTTRQSDEH